MASISSLIAFISSLIASLIAFISSLMPFSTSSSSSSVSSSSPSSPSSSIPQKSYDVFLSFRGDDTRYNFTDHLYNALVNRGICTFRDDKLNRGEEIASELFKVIESSRFSTVVFSENYADSKWCLNELVKIMECREKMGQIVLSIFYHVDPTDVRKQTGSFGKAFNNYKKEKKEMVQRWRTALTEAANISGWHLSDGYESMHIKKIAGDIFSRLDRPFIHIDKNLVGLDSQLEELTLRLCMDSTDVRMVGIYGCGGIGKTTLAKVVCNEIFHRYDGTIFLSNVREVSASPAGLVKLQEQLLNELVREEHSISDVDQGKIMIQNTLCCNRVLIIVDDIDNQRQLESLVGRKEWFGPGSRIIITTRNKHLLEVHHSVDESYHMEVLDAGDDIELFSWKAFGQNHPEQEYICLSNSIVDYAKGLPLALEILGSSLYAKKMPEWVSELDKLKCLPNKEILDVLKISYDALDRLEKDLFLDIACFFKGKNRDFVSRILDGCKFFASTGIGHLCDRSLITFLNDWICMHDLIQQMGWEIVREKFPGDPNRWSRLWEPEDVYQAFIRNQGMANVEAIFMDLSRLKQIRFNSEAWAEMTKLRLLKIFFSDEKFMQKQAIVHFPEDFEFPSDNLSYLCWERCPLKSLPSNFVGGNLVEIRFSDSNIRQIWPNGKCLGMLKILNLKGSKKLSQISDFSTTPNLEYLDLTLCVSLEEIDSSIGVLEKLTGLSLKSCRQLRSLPSSILYLDSLENLYLTDCLNFDKFPEMQRERCMQGLRRLSLSNCCIKELPSSIGHLAALKYLCVVGCKNLMSLPTNICKLKSLAYLSLKDCFDLATFPEIMEDMPELLSLDLAGTAIKEIPSSVQRMNRLQSLNMGNCRDLVTLPDTIYNLEFLRFLSVNGSAKLEKLPRNLEKLHISQCKLLVDIPELPSTLRKITAHDCTARETFLNPSTVHSSSLLKLFTAATQEPKSYEGGIENYVGGIENYVRIELPMNLSEDNNFLGFGFCILYDKVPNPGNRMVLEYSWILLDCRGVMLDFAGDWPDRCGCGEGYGSVPDQLWMVFYPKAFFLGSLGTHECRELEFFEDKYEKGGVYTIKSLGVHLIYIQDHQPTEPYA